MTQTENEKKTGQFPTTGDSAAKAGRRIRRANRHAFLLLHAAGESYGSHRASCQSHLLSRSTGPIIWTNGGKTRRRAGWIPAFLFFRHRFRESHRARPFFLSLSVSLSPLLRSTAGEHRSRRFQSLTNQPRKRPEPKTSRYNSGTLRVLLLIVAGRNRRRRLFDIASPFFGVRILSLVCRHLAPRSLVPPQPLQTATGAPRTRCGLYLGGCRERGYLTSEIGYSDAVPT